MRPPMPTAEGRFLMGCTMRKTALLFVDCADCAVLGTVRTSAPRGQFGWPVAAIDNHDDRHHRGGRGTSETKRAATAVRRLYGKPGPTAAVCLRWPRLLFDRRDRAVAVAALSGEKGDWTISGIIWSLAGGALGALGALGIILAFTFGGRPVYVMPLVFGGAPVVNAFLTIYRAVG